MNDDLPKYFNAVLYFLHGLGNVRDETKYEKFERYLSRNCDVEELEQYAEVARWATADESLDLKTIGVGTTLRHKNEDIHFFLKKLIEIVEKLVSEKK